MQRARKSSTVHAQTCMDDIDSYLLIEILQRLPNAKFTTQCKLVSRNWNSLISSPYFATRFNHHHRTCTSIDHDPENPFALIRTNLAVPLEYHFVSQDPIIKSMKLEIPNFLLKTDGFCMRVKAACNDLLVLSVFWSTEVVGNTSYYIFNPLTHHSVALPPPPSAYDSYMDIFVGFVCNDHHWKVVRIVKLACSYFELTQLPLNCAFRMFMFSSETNQWSDLDALHPFIDYDAYFTYSMHSLSCNGILHWLGLDRPGFKLSLIAYDLNKGRQQFCFIDLPKELVQDTPYFTLEDKDFKSDKEPLKAARVGLGVGRSPGSLLRLLCLTKAESSAVKHSLRVWELKSYDEGQWMLVREVCVDSRLNSAMKRTNHLMQSAKAVYLDPNDEDVVYLFVSDEYLVSFNMRTKKVRRLGRSYGQRNGDISYGNRQFYASFQLVLPWWPTKVPAIPQAPLN